MVSKNKLVHMFEEGDKSMKMLLGGKGANLAEMTRIGLPVPYGFTITTDVCKAYYENGKKHPELLDEQMFEAVKKLETKTGKKFGDEKKPLLVSVRSGAPASMPGMMDTILNLGINDVVVETLTKETNNPRFAWDSYRRFITMFGDVVMEVDRMKFEHIMDEIKHKNKIKLDTELTTEMLKELVTKQKELYKKETGEVFPQNPIEQLKRSRDAVFRSWMNDRAIVYRRINHVPSDWGTAVNVQEMVFGNMGEDSGTGVAFTRNPSTGENKFYGEFLMNAQGEDVVAGIRTPKKVEDLGKVLPKVYEELVAIRSKLESAYKDMQDFEFTIEHEKLYMLQTRNGKRTAHAAVKIAVDMEKEKLITKEEAVLRVEPASLDQLLHKQFDPKHKYEVLTEGLPASPGAAVGKVVFNAEDAKMMAEKGEKVILSRLETSPEDIEGMHSAVGILTARGGMTCVGGESLLLTDKGFFGAEQLFNEIEKEKKISILSFDSKSMKSVWKPVIAAGRKKSDTIEVNFSQSGRTKENSLVLTPDHKMIIIQNRELVKKPFNEVLKEKEFISIVDKIPFEAKNTDSKFAYLVGAISTDGYTNLSSRRGYTVFTQKNIPSKERFIGTINQYFLELFGYEMKQRVKESNSFINGRHISGTATDFICHNKTVTAQFVETKQELAQWALELDEFSTLNFLAGAIDGDGSFSGNRIHIYVSKENLAQALVVSCLKLGVVPQVSVNRNIYNIQIVEKMNEILTHSKRFLPRAEKKLYESKLFAPKQLLADILEKSSFSSNSKQRIRDGITRNLLFGKEKLEKYVTNLSDVNAKNKLENIFASDLRMYRADKTKEMGEQMVYNFEVYSENELDKNFVVFTKRYTPILVSNSHAAVVARGMGKCCVAGCDEITMDEKGKKFTCKGTVVKEGDIISLNGSTGHVIIGAVPVVEPTLSGDFEILMKWADEFRKLKIRTNADTPKDAKIAREFGAEGIGLVRTEHMFFDATRIKAVREMILAKDVEGRKKALKKIEPFQQEDFEGIFEVMDGLPVIIRMLDPPLHEFLPKQEQLKEIEEISKELGTTPKTILETIESLHEFNPMLGFRGCRLAIVYSEIMEMQVRAIFNAALSVQKKGIKALPEIEIPLVGNVKEYIPLAELTHRIAKEVGAEGKVHYTVGTMLEVPRAALTADVLAREAEFMSFGTNDLTQMTCGFSRDDAGKFLGKYVEKRIYERDPFQSIDEQGVGLLMEHAVKLARGVNPKIDIGICGEHGGDPTSVEFCHKIGMSNVSCSPYRVPIARLAAAQAAIKEKRK